MSIRSSYRFAVFLSLFCLPATGQEDSSFARWRHCDSSTQHEILALARRTFDTYVREHRVIAPPTPLPPLLEQRCGVFVSSMRNGAPRCCMGTLYPMQPSAALEIIENAVAAAGRDRLGRAPPKAFWNCSTPALEASGAVSTV